MAATLSQSITLVTGASGHVGANLVRALLDRGRERVRVILRRSSNNTAMDGLNVEVVWGDLTDEASCREALKDVAHVYHCAAFVSIRHGDREELFKVNIEASRRFVGMAREAGVRRVLYVSSFGAVGNTAPLPSTEESTFNPYEINTDYEVSKGFSEGEILREAAKGLDVVIVNPSGIVGRHDYKPSMVGKTILEFSEGRIWSYPTGGFEFVHIADVVEGCLRAMEVGRSGERYILSGEWASMETIFGYLSEFLNVPPPSICIPAGVILPIAYVKDWVDRVFFPETIPRFTYGSITLLNCGKSASHKKAEEELGLKFHPVKEAFRDAVEWFVATGRIRVGSKL